MDKSSTATASPQSPCPCFFHTSPPSEGQVAWGKPLRDQPLYVCPLIFATDCGVRPARQLAATAAQRSFGITEPPALPPALSCHVGLLAAQKLAAQFSAKTNAAAAAATTTGSARWDAVHVKGTDDDDGLDGPAVTVAAPRDPKRRRTSPMR